MFRGRAGHGFKQGPVFAPQARVKLVKIVLFRKGQVKTLPPAEALVERGGHQASRLIPPFVDELRVAAGLHLKQIQPQGHHRDRAQRLPALREIRHAQRRAGRHTSGQRKDHKRQKYSVSGHVGIIA